MFSDELARIDQAMCLCNHNAATRLSHGLAVLNVDERLEFRPRRPRLDTATQDFMSMSSSQAAAVRVRMTKRREAK